MSNKLDRELDKLCKKEDSNSSKKTQESLLLLEAPKESLDVLKQINLDYQIFKKEKVFNIINKVKTLSDLYGRRTITGKEVKELCNFYDLKCASAQYYRGELDSELPSKLIEFQNDSKEHLTGSNTFILSTQRSFDSKDDLNDNCIFLYREGNGRDKVSENDVFVVIHSWGDNIKDSRKYNYLLSGQMFLALVFLIIGLVVTSMILTTILLVSSIICITEKSLCETSEDLLWNDLERK